MVDKDNEVEEEARDPDEAAEVCCDENTFSQGTTATRGYTESHFFLKILQNY